MAGRHNPTQPVTKALAARLGSGVFVRRARQAETKARRVEAVKALRESGLSECAAIREGAPGLSRGGYQRQRASLEQRQGEGWERLMDRRAPPKSWQVPESWRVVAEGCRRMKPDASVEEVRAALVGQFGAEASLSDTQLRAIFRKAGLARPGGRALGQASAKEVEELTGGGGLALVLAAAAESGAIAGLAEAIGQAVAALPRNPDAPPEAEGRDARGRLTAEYNRNRLSGVAPGAPDPRFRSIEETRAEKDLGRLSIRKMSREKVEDRLLVATVTPLVTERRGMVGLDSPAGAWTQVVSPTAYRWRTMDKLNAELKYAGVGTAMWDRHLAQWAEHNARWTDGQGFRQFVAYLDGSQDPWWTHEFARSGKVARVGRVMPCMSRLLLCGGAGTPLLVDSFSGQASIKKQLPSVLGRVDRILGPGKLARLLVVDAELVSVDLFEALTQSLKGEYGGPRRFITVLKGSVLKGLQFEQTGEPVAYRERDQLREGVVQLNRPARPKTKGAPEGEESPSDEGGDSPCAQKKGPSKKYPIRVVEMLRPDGRHPTPTYFATSAPVEELPTELVADAYLERWPHNEAIFRRARDGAGLERSQGYGRRSVHNVAIVTEREEVAAQLVRARAKETEVATQVAALREELDRERNLLKERRKKRRQAVYVGAADRRIAHQKRHVAALAAELKAADKRRAAVAARRKDREDEAARLASMPDFIVERDVELDSIGTCIKLTLVALFEFILREYFGGARMELRTFIEGFVGLPVRIEQTRQVLRFVIHPSSRSPVATGKLATACAEVTRRRVRHHGRRLILEVRPSDPGG